MKNLIGQVLLDQFRVDAFIASGGMGAVYRVWDLKRNVPLAMKVLHADLADDPSVLKRFTREARALQKLAHPNIVAFYGLYHTPYFSFLLEDYVDGATLNEILRHRRNRPLAIRDSLIFLKAISAALGYAHVHGVVHCDVKPGNVMIDQGGQIYLTDFGIVRHAESTVTTLGVAGSPAYMAPEQIRGEPVRPATDVYALGVMLFEMLTGQRPFRGDEEGTESSGTTAAERIRYAQLHLPPPNPRNLNLSISESLAIVILKALAKDPRARFQDTNQMLAEAGTAEAINIEEIPNRIDSQLLQDLREFWASIPDVGSEEEEIVEYPVIPPPGLPIEKRPQRRYGRIFAFLGIGLVLMAVGVLLVLSMTNRNGIPTPEPIAPSSAPVSESNSITIEEEPEVVVIERPTATKLPTNTSVSPTKTRKPATKTSVPPTVTSKPLTPTPRPARPIFVASENMFCRAGPDSSYEEHYTVMAGQEWPVLARWNDEWFLLGIDDPSKTRTRCCWVGGDGSLNVRVEEVPIIDYLVDRIDCPLYP